MKAAHASRRARPETRRGRAARSWLEVNGIECRMRIGLGAEERRTPQRVVVDVAVQGGAESSGCETLERRLREETRRFLSAGEFVLIEATILKLARRVFERTPARRVRVRFHKFVLPGTDHVAVEMAFRRAEVRP